MAIGKIDFKTVNFQFQPFDEYRVRLLIPRLAGGIPMNRKLIDQWIDATNKSKSAEERQRIKDATPDELPQVATETAEKGWTTFKRDDRGFYLEGRCLKAALKEAANILKQVAPDGKGARGIARLRSKMADQVFVREEKVYLKTPDGKIKTAADQVEERPIHVETAQGPRDSLKRVDVMENTVLELTVCRLAGGEVPEVTLMACLQYLGELGVGADRSQGVGKVIEIDVEKITEVDLLKAAVATRGRTKT